MKSVIAFVTLLVLSACVTPTYKHGIYDGRQKVGFKAKHQNGMHYYLCVPSETSKETWDRGEKAHAFAEAKRKQYLDTFFDPMLKSLKERDALKSLRLRADIRKFDDSVAIEMEERFRCAFYAPPQSK